MESTLANAETIPAAVLIPLLVGETNTNAARVRLRTRTGHLDIPLSTEVLLTVRTHTVAHHKGQISFPGGVVEPEDESLEETALRESHEEIGLPRELVEIVAELPDIPTVASRFKVRPYVGIIRTKPVFQPNPNEIGEIILVPLRHLLDPANSILETYERGGLKHQIRAYHYHSHRIWGATGFMLQTFLEKYLITP